MTPDEAGVVILAAGKSERMKEMKAFLPFDNDNTFLEKIISTYSDWGCSEIVVVTNQPTFLKIKETNVVSSKVTVVVNDHLEFERFYSVKLGIRAIGKSSFCFIHNVDNPFIDSQILDIIYQKRSNEKYVSPVFNNRGGHPVLLNRENIDQICNWKENSDNLKIVLNTMECRQVEMPDDKVLININSPEEYKKYFFKNLEWN